MKDVNSLVYLGKKIRFLPGYLDSRGRDEEGTDNTRIGTVTYINEPHQYFIVDYITNTGAVIREAIKYQTFATG